MRLGTAEARTWVVAPVAPEAEPAAEDGSVFDRLAAGVATPFTTFPPEPTTDHALPVEIVEDGAAEATFDAAAAAADFLAAVATLSFAARARRRSSSS